MGADNWTVCPKCFAEAQKSSAEAQRQRQKKLDASYGNVSAEEYQKLLAVHPPAEVKVDETYSEYYGLGMDRSGKFSVDYSAECRKCKFRFSFKHEVQALKGYLTREAMC